MPWRWVNIRPNRKTVILCIDPDSDSDVVIEEWEGNFKERCVIKGDEKNVEEEAEQADNEQYEQPTETETEPGMSLVTEQETEPGTSLGTEQEIKDKDETFQAPQPKILIEKRSRENL